MHKLLKLLKIDINCTSGCHGECNKIEPTTNRLIWSDGKWRHTVENSIHVCILQITTIHRLVANRMHIAHCTSAHTSRTFIDSINQQQLKCIRILSFVTTKNNMMCKCIQRMYAICVCKLSDGCRQTKWTDCTFYQNIYDKCHKSQQKMPTDTAATDSNMKWKQTGAHKRNKCDDENLCTKRIESTQILEWIFK